jgi:3-hydroxybutyryl-CoA dehydrogenase
MTSAELAELPHSAVVVGAGTMGARIAVCLARAGIEVTASARSIETLRAAEVTVGAAQAADLGRRHVRDLITLTTDPGRGLDHADLVVETIREDADDKRRVLDSIQARVRPDAIVTTNTSSLDLSDLSGVVKAPQRFAGLHWFHPADVLALVEVVPGPQTSEETTRTLASWMTQLGKTPIVLRQAVRGFVGNRLQYALLREAYALVAEGACSRAEIDLAVTHGLAPRWAGIGPFLSMDLAGLDVHLAVARTLFPALSSDTEPPAELVQLVNDGQLGVKSGSGLLGTYSSDERDRLAERRDAMLRTVAKAQDEENR